MANPPFESKQAMKSFILESTEEITALLRAISHPKRFLLLGLLLDESQSDLNTLVEKTGMQKSALGNHLGILIEKNLVEKLDRGVYRLTIAGEELLQATTQSFLETKLREHERWEQLRRRIGRYTTYYTEEAPMTEKTLPEPRIVEKEAFTIVGMHYRGKNEHKEAHYLWDKFLPREGEIQGRIPKILYGVSYNIDEKTGEFDYIAGVEVKQVKEIPKGMVNWKVPTQTYAVFPCTLPTFSKIFHHFNKIWLPKSGYQAAKGPELEFYDENFDPENADNSDLSLYLPITKAEE